MEQINFENFNNRKLAYVLNDTGSKKIVVMAHGFRGSKSGPNRLFVVLSRMLAEKGISSLRFDQYGCGDSEGDFSEVSFIDWIKSISYFTEKFSKEGYQVALFGQSMGATASLVAASEVGVPIRSVSAWVPDLKIDVPETAKSGTLEEGGQIFKGEFWKEAQEANTLNAYKKIPVPVFVLASRADEMVSLASNRALFEAKQDKDIFLIMDDWKHSGWTYEQSQTALSQTVDFIAAKFE